MAVLCGVVLSSPAPAWAIPTDPGGDDGNPCEGITGSLTLSASMVLPGQAVVATWETQRPPGCGTVSMLTGPGTSGAVNGMGGTQTVVPPSSGTNTYTVTAFYPGGSVEVASASVTVQACTSDPGVTWAVDAAHPVFYGAQDLTVAGDGVPADMRIYYPSADGTPSTARMLACGSAWPVVLFLHGQPPDGLPGPYNQRWFVLPAELARSGYVVVVPNYNAQLATAADAPAMVSAAMQDVSWARHNWAHSDRVDQRPERTAVMGHSYGAILAARVAAAHPEMGAFVSLSGPFDELGDAQALLQSITVPALYMWGRNLLFEDLDVFGDRWNRLTRLRYAAVFDGEHFDYLRPQDSGGAPRGSCPLIGGTAADLATLFVSPRVRVGSSTTVFPLDLSVPAVTLTPQQQFYAGGHLTTLGQLNTTAGCHVNIRFRADS